jgi:hypothetical protein
MDDLSYHPTTSPGDKYRVDTSSSSCRSGILTRARDTHKPGVVFTGTKELRGIVKSGPLRIPGLLEENVLSLLPKVHLVP